MATRRALNAVRFTLSSSLQVLNHNICVSQTMVFEKQLMQLIQNVSTRTNGKSEFLLINGVPRVEKGTLETTGVVEKISDAYQRIAKEHGLVLCNTIDLYNQLPLAEKKTYYKDTVHQTPEGLKFIGKQIAKILK